MIYIGILNTAGIDSSDSRVISKIPDEARGRVEKTKDEREKANRIGAYLMIFRLCESLFDIKNLQIFYTDKGKPYLNTRDCVNNNSQIMPNISISHDGDISAVVLCDDNFDVGIDVQTAKTNINYEAVSKRFFDKTRALKGESVPLVKCLTEEPVLLNKDVSFKCFNFVDDSIFEVPYTEFLSQSGLFSQKEWIFLKKWTYLEAHLKMSGEGFSGITSFDEIADGSECGCMEFFKKGKLYLLSISVKENKII